jgi:hypothetical protein
VGGQNLSFQGYGQLQQQAQQQQQQAANNSMSPEENLLLTEANRQVAVQNNDPAASAYPPSPLEYTKNGEAQSGTQTPAEGTTPGQTTTPQNQLPIPGRPPGYRPY